RFSACYQIHSTFTGLTCPFLTIFFFNDTATTEIYTLSLHDALPICKTSREGITPSDLAPMLTIISSLFTLAITPVTTSPDLGRRSEEHTSELQSRENLVCRLLLEKKKKKTKVIACMRRVEPNTIDRP